MIGKSPMKDWKAAVRNWNRKRFVQNNESSTKTTNPRIDIPAQNPDEYVSTF